VIIGVQPAQALVELGADLSMIETGRNSRPCSSSSLAAEITAGGPCPGGGDAHAVEQRKRLPVWRCDAGAR
jgi:hypothetical protein